MISGWLETNKIGPLLMPFVATQFRDVSRTKNLTILPTYTFYNSNYILSQPINISSTNCYGATLSAWHLNCYKNSFFQRQNAKPIIEPNLYTFSRFVIRKIVLYPLCTWVFLSLARSRHIVPCPVCRSWRRRSLWPSIHMYPRIQSCAITLCGHNKSDQELQQKVT